MKNKITHNLLLKIMSVVFAFVLWLVVVNINDPDTVKTVRSVEITILNEQAITGQGQGQVYTIKENRTATIVVKGPRSVVDNLDKSEIKATADFSEVSSVGAVPINIVSLPDGVSLQSKVTENMKISIEPLLTERFQVEIETIGTPADGYVVGGTEVSPNVVNIKAPQSVMEQIQRAVVRVDVDGMSTDVSGKSLSLVLIDGNGKEMDYTENEHVTLSSVVFLAGADILRCHSIPMEFAVSGEPEDGYRYTGMELSHSSVTLKGTRSAMAAAGVISVPALEESLTLTGLTETKESVVDILPYLPEGTTLMDEMERYVTVTLKIEQLQTRSIHVSTDSLTVLNAPENLEITYEISPDSMLVLEGLQADLSALTLGTLKPTIDLKDLQAGSYVCAVEVTVPDGIEVTRQAHITVILNEILPPEESSSGEEKEEESQVVSETTAPRATTAPETTIPVMVKPAETTTREHETTKEETTVNATTAPQQTSEKQTTESQTTEKETTGK